MMRVLALVLALATVAAASRVKKETQQHMQADAAPEKQQDLYKCETLTTYNARDAAKTCEGKKVNMACFSLSHQTAWQCFDDEAAASKADCSTSYDGACVFARDFTFWGKLDGSQIKATDDKGSASGRSMAGLLVVAAGLVAMM